MKLSCFGRLSRTVLPVTLLVVSFLNSGGARAFGNHDYGLAPGQTWVQAESQSGNGRISAPVRYTSKGPQIRLPGGNWIYCDHTCSETLRLATVDFWQSQQADRDNGDGGCGLITCRLRFNFSY